MLEWAAQGGRGVTVPGGVQEKTGRGTQCNGLAEKLITPRLELILQVFSNRNDSMIG